MYWRQVLAKFLICLLVIVSFSSMQFTAEASCLSRLKKLPVAALEIAGKSTFAPLFVFLIALRNRGEGESIKESFAKAFKEYRAYLALYGVLFVGLNSFVSHYYVIDLQNFMVASENAMASKPASVLYLLSFPKIDNAGAAIYSTFESEKGVHIYFSGTKDLVEKLKALPEGIKFDRIEIAMHGVPGKLKTGDFEFLDIPMLKREGFDFGKQHLDIRVVACSVSCGTPFAKSDQSLQANLAHAFSKREVRVITATRDINALAALPALNDIRKTTYGLAFFIGIGPFANAWENIPNVWRNYSESSEDIEIVEVQADPTASLRNPVAK
jgi:hypothetical protein